jgi:DNA modification methylase
MPFEITKTELVWPGKYDENGKRREPPRVSLPFQVIERVNESRATREAEKRRDLTLFDVWKGDEGETFEEGWRNKLIWGDNLLVMSSLLDQFAGKIDLIYIDPPFASGTDFALEVPVGDGSATVHKEQSLLEEKTYWDTWGAGRSSYLSMMFDRIQLMHSLLSPRGLFFLHCDWHLGHALRALLDEVFGAERFVNEIVWHYYNKYSAGRRCIPRAHDTILVYSKSAEYTLKEFREQRDEPVKQLVRENVGGVLRNKRDASGQVQYRTVVDKKGDDVWRIPQLQPASGEWTGFETQKHPDLITRILELASEPAQLVADFFVGSGTTAVVAERLGRRWIAVDLGRYAIHLTRKRLLDIAGCRPFEVLNLGKYERQYWQVATFGEDLDQDGSIALYEYIAFILKLYGATAVSGMGSLHGKTGKAFVHVGAVDSPVTIQEIAEAIEECKAVKGTELHVLGWEWEMGLNDLMVDEAKRQGVKLLLRQIPREVMETQAAAKGDVRFFELAYVDFEVKPTKRKREFQVVLRDFAIPNPELVPDEARSKIKKWSDYVDYWAVDWDFRDDTFMQDWVTYRTRKDRSLELKSDPHTYEEPGEYAVMVKVIDIFGNDTSKVVRIKVK